MHSRPKLAEKARYNSLVKIKSTTTTTTTTNKSLPYELNRLRLHLYSEHQCPAYILKKFCLHYQFSIRQSTIGRFLLNLVLDQSCLINQIGGKEIRRLEERLFGNSPCVCWELPFD